MESQKELIHDVDWDTLIILDACRYDYFEEIYRNYLSGNLNRVESLGYSTPMWLKKTFTGSYKDTIYVSGNPFVNSKVKMKGFYGKEKFFKVFDIWDGGFDNDKGTVPPETISKTTRIARMEKPNKKIIAHFIQPHGPYLGFPESKKFFTGLNEVKSETMPKMEKLAIYLGEIASKVIGASLVHKVGNYLNLNNPSPLERIAEEYGENKLCNSYRNNLKIVLNEVSKLAKRLPGKIIISADHGEMLGEDDLYSHNSHHHLLKEAPWLEVEGVKG
ncbi:hypothetical protein AKJ38_01740 [candidate division MSBL1 archaeon SCGC-AAA259I14]|uniref:Sulfatase N-terminal domain-containing protein n=1 Tax=candidate division MSBL1 archaeon SCGC-AAA259I14 TaxID=1698268 RepID=A0A133UST3_9EURY|nr:hypothetical protein AKJ38_01740 [candidate division MSBL1 archaeon SCGC-AAA259I14]